MALCVVALPRKNWGMMDHSTDRLTFPFVRTAPRPAKPRDAGLAILADRGMGLNRVADIIGTSGGYIDFYKFAIGANRAQREKHRQVNEPSSRSPTRSMDHKPVAMPITSAQVLKAWVRDVRCSAALV